MRPRLLAELSSRYAFEREKLPHRVPLCNFVLILSDCFELTDGVERDMNANSEICAVWLLTILAFGFTPPNRAPSLLPPTQHEATLLRNRLARTPRFTRRNLWARRFKCLRRSSHGRSKPTGDGTLCMSCR